MSFAASGAKCQAVGVAKIRADGTKVDLGVWSFQHKNPVIHWAVNLWIKAKVVWFKMRGVI